MVEIEIRPMKAGPIAENFDPRKLTFSTVAHIASQTGVSAEAYFEGEWSERTQRHQRSQIREHCGFQIFHADDEPAFIAWLTDRVTHPNTQAEAFKIAAYGHLRSQCLEPPATERLRRLLRLAVAQRGERLVAEAAEQLSSATCQALDALVNTQTEEGSASMNQIPLFPIRSELATVKDDTGAVSVETVLDEIELRTLDLPERLFRDVLAKLVTHYRQRAASEPPRELRRHPPENRYTLLAALCWQRQQEITDNLVELLIHIAHRVGVRAEEGVVELLKFAKKVVGKAKLLYKLAKAAKEQPDGIVKDVLYPAIGEKIAVHALEAFSHGSAAAERHPEIVYGVGIEALASFFTLCDDPFHPIRDTAFHGFCRCCLRHNRLRQRSLYAKKLSSNERNLLGNGRFPGSRRRDPRPALVPPHNGWGGLRANAAWLSLLRTIGARDTFREESQGGELCRGGRSQCARPGSCSADNG